MSIKWYDTDKIYKLAVPLCSVLTALVARCDDDDVAAMFEGDAHKSEALAEAKKILEHCKEAEITNV